MQALFLQAGLAMLLLVIALFSWRDTQAMLLFGVTLVIPVGWGYAFWRAYRKDLAARDAGTWTPQTDREIRKSTFSLIGILFAVWIALAAAVLLLL